MKIHITLHSGNSASAQAVHKAVQNRNFGRKSDTHRYERRKVREFLRHAQADADNTLEFAE
jgi:hypothetical protein